MRWRTALACSAVLFGSLGTGCAPEAEPPSAPEPRFTRAATMPDVDLSPDENAAPGGLADEPFWTVHGAVMPRVVGDLVVGRFDVNGTSEGRLQAVDGRSGRVRWWTQLREPRGSAAAQDEALPQVRVDGDRATLYTVAESTNQDDDSRAYLVAIDVVDGTARWTVPVGDVVEGRDDSLFGIERPGDSARLLPSKVPPPSPRTTVVQTHHAVLVGWSTTREDDREPTTYAFDPATGRPLWRRAGLPATASADQVVLEQRLPGDEVDRSRFVAVDSRRGDPRWDKEGYGGAVANPDASSVLLTEPPYGGDISAPNSLRADDGASISELDADIDQCRAGTDSYVCMRDDTTPVGHEVFAIDATTGRERWRVRCDAIGLTETPRLAAVEGSHVSLLPAGDGPGAVLDLRTGRVLQRTVEQVPLQLGNGFALGEIRRNDSRVLGVFRPQH